MDLFKIQHELIAARSADGWYRLRVGGTPFHCRRMNDRGDAGELGDVGTEHRERAVCREQPDLTMSWGMESPNPVPNFEWATSLVDSIEQPFCVDFFWSNALIDRVELCRIDSGKGIVPIPDPELRVTDFETAVAYLVHYLEDRGNEGHPGRYLKAIGAKSVRDRSRQGAGTIESGSI